MRASTLNHTKASPFPNFTPAQAAGFISFFSSLILFALSNSYNSDSIVYLHTADVFSSSGWEAAKAIYPRPFYSALIGLFSNATHLSTEVSAQLVSSSLVALTAFGFVHLLSSLGANTQTLKIGAVIICIYPGIASYKDYFIRDFGYWSFMLLTISLCISHYRTCKRLDLMLWLLFGGLATFFRPEALALVLALFLSSLTLTITTFKTKKCIFIQYIVVSALITCGLLALSFLSTTTPLDAIHEYAIYVPTQTLSRLIESWEQVSSTLELEILNRHSREFADTSLIAIYATIYLSQLANGLSVPFTAGLLYFLCKRQLELPNPKFVVVTAAITILMTTIFLVSKQFIQTRYLVLLCLLLLIPLTFSISHRADEFSATTKKALLIIAALMFIDGHVSFGHSKKFIADSILWTKVNSPDKATIISNDPQISYLSGREYNFKQLNLLRNNKELDTSQIPSGYDIIAWKSEKGKSPSTSFTIQQTTYHQVTFFANKRDDRVTIYRAQ